MKALTIKSDQFLSFVRASQIARTQGYHSRLLLPGETWESTPDECTRALFISQPDHTRTHCLRYHDLTRMSEDALCTTLEHPASAPIEQLS